MKNVSFDLIFKHPQNIYNTIQYFFVSLENKQYKTKNNLNSYKRHIEAENT